MAIKSFFRTIGESVHPRGEVIAAHAVAVEPYVHRNAVASIISQDITDIEARFDVEGPICWRDPMIHGRYEREHRRRAIADRNIGRGRR